MSTRKARDGTWGPTVWVNGEYAAGTGTRGLQDGGVAFAFVSQAGTLNNVRIEATLDMKWFNAFTRHINREAGRAGPAFDLSHRSSYARPAHSSAWFNA